MVQGPRRPSTTEDRGHRDQACGKLGGRSRVDSPQQRIPTVLYMYCTVHGNGRVHCSFVPWYCLYCTVRICVSTLWESSLTVPYSTARYSKVPYFTATSTTPLQRNGFSRRLIVQSSPVPPRPARVLRAAKDGLRAAPKKANFVKGLGSGSLVGEDAPYAKSLGRA